MEKFGVGQGVRREEDPRLLKGKGLFVNDVNIPKLISNWSIFCIRIPL